MLHLRKLIFWSVTSIAFLLVITLIFLQTDLFQNFLADYLLKIIEDRTHQTAKIKNIKVKWFDFVEIKGLEVRDYQGELMIGAHSVSVDYNFGDLFTEGRMLVDRVVLRNSELNLIKYKDSLNINLLEFINELNDLNRGVKSNSRGGGTTINIGKIRLDNFFFSYDDRRRDSLSRELFDYGHFRLDIPVASILDFELKNRSIGAKIRSFEARSEDADLRVQKLKTDFLLTDSSIVFDKLLLETLHSTIQESVRFRFSGLDDLGSFVDSVGFEMDLKGAIIAKKDLDFFANIPANNFKVELTALVTGGIPRFSIEDMKLAVGDTSFLYGNIDFVGLPILKETFVDLRINDGEILPSELNSFYEIGKELDAFGPVGFSGRFIGFINDFVAKTAIQTDQGNIQSDLNLKFEDGWENARYSGSLTLDNFNLGTFFQDSLKVGTVNFNGKIDGQGLTRKNANFFLNATLTNSTFFGYRYNEIKAKGDFAAEFLKGELAINDKNCQVDILGDIDLRKSSSKVQLNSTVDTLDLLALGFTKKPLAVSAKVNADISDLRLDSLQGMIAFQDLQLNVNHNFLNLNLVEISSRKENDSRFVKLTLPDLDMKLEGDFVFSRFIEDIENLTTEVRNYFIADSPSTGQKAGSGEEYDPYTIDFTINYGDINKYLKLFANDIYLSKNGSLDGSYYQRRNATLSLFADIDSINFRGIAYKENLIDINFSKDLDSTGIVSSMFISSRKQTWRAIEPTEDLQVEGVWYNNRINLNVSIEQPDNNASVKINSEIKLFEDRFTFSFLPSEVIANGEQWHFNPFNKIDFTKQKILFNRVELYQNEQSIMLSGTYSDIHETALDLSIKAFDLQILSMVLPTSVRGVLNSKVGLTRLDFNDSYKLISELDVDSLVINGFSIGDLKGLSDWNSARNALGINFDITRRSVNTMKVSGFYYPDRGEDQLEIQSSFKGIALGVAEPFMTGLFSNIRGQVDGAISFSGTLEKPILEGLATVEDARMRFDYLGATYDFSSELSFDNRSINFDRVALIDREGDRAFLNGKIYHDGFTAFKTDLKVAASNFTFLNTTDSDNSLYYGTVNASGDITITGPFDDLQINATAITERGTKIYIPLSTDNDVTQKEYITFVDFSDTVNQVDLNEIVQQSISGIKLNFDIDVTTDAYVELIFNKRTGDIIRGRGDGNLKLLLDTGGDFQLFGDLTISEGAYNFTIPNLISKEFKVEPGSKISWYGDPYKGILDLKAVYRQLASFGDFRPTDLNESVAQKYPILVVLKLQGEMLSPDIDFQIRMDDTQSSPTNDTQLMLQNINSDEQQLKRQVFSLLILKKFSPEQSFDVSASSGFSSVSEFLSSQFSYFISQVDENLEIDVDLSSLDADAFNAFQLRFSYTFLDGRLRLSGGGGFPRQTADEANGTSFIGDWTVRYLLTQDGHFRVKAFSQSEQVAGTPQRETGVSFQYVKSFDDFRDLLKKSREEAIRSINSKPKNVEAEREANAL